MARHRPRSEWHWLVHAQLESGLTQTEFARRHGIEVASLRRWRTVFAAANVTACDQSFVELTVPTASSQAWMTVHFGAASLALSSQPDPHWLAALMRELAMQPC
jgi:transposase-like protein